MPWAQHHFLVTCEEMSGLPDLTPIGTTNPQDAVKAEKPKREKREYLDPETKTIPVGSSLFNGIFAFLARECQCRPEITPKKLADISSRWVAQIAILIGENNEEYDKVIFESCDKAIFEVSALKLAKEPVTTAAHVFHYETKRPKRERVEGEEGEITKTKPAKKAKKNSDDEGVHYDSEGNVVSRS